MFGRFHALAVDDRGRGPGGPRLLPDFRPQDRANPLPGSVALPESNVIKHDPARRQIVRHRSPPAAVAGHVENGIHDSAAGRERRPDAGLGSWHTGGDPPLPRVGQIGGIRVPSHAATIIHAKARKIPRSGHARSASG